MIKSMKNTLEIKKFIKKHSYLFWYTPEDKKKDIGEDLLLETGVIKSVGTGIQVLSFSKKRIFTFHNDQYHRDIDTMESYNKANQDFSC